MVLCGVVFPIGSVRLGAVSRIETKRRIFALSEPAPKRAVEFLISENRTDPHHRKLLQDLICVSYWWTILQAVNPTNTPLIPQQMASSWVQIAHRP